MHFIYPLALEEGLECCHEKPIASRHSGYNSHWKHIILVILSTNGYQENRKYFCLYHFLNTTPPFFFNHILRHVLQGNTWNGIANFATSRVLPRYFHIFLLWSYFQTYWYFYPKKSPLDIFFKEDTTLAKTKYSTCLLTPAKHVWMGSSENTARSIF